MRKSYQSNTIGTPTVTRFNRLHPYPAMVADELALLLVNKYISPQAHVLDPFCGSGRLLAAAGNAAVRVGIDVNPLAWLLTKTKLTTLNLSKINNILKDLEAARSNVVSTKLVLASSRKVAWFSNKSLEDLGIIVDWINGLHLDEPELLLLASVLSATTREVSYARQGGWKLHRLSADDRANFKVSAWDRFKRRLSYCARTLTSGNIINGDIHVKIADSRNPQTFSGLSSLYGEFDVVITSPPYGDSISTVQYGAASSLSLEAVGHLNGLQHLVCAGSVIDGTCLGGGQTIFSLDSGMAKYWGGGGDSFLARSVAKFLLDYDLVCQNIADCVKPGGKVILIVGRRSTGGFRLKLDTYSVDRLAIRGFKLVSNEERPLNQKRFPTHINRFARSHSESCRDSGEVITMQNEIILVLEKTL